MIDRPNKYSSDGTKVFENADVRLSCLETNDQNSLAKKSLLLRWGRGNVWAVLMHVSSVTYSNPSI